MELRPGYKQTELGIIPEDWDIQSIGQVFRLSNGCAFKPEDWKQSGTPIIRIQNLNDANASFNYTQAPLGERHRVETGDLLFAWSGTIGTSFGARVWAGPPGVLNQHIFKVLMDEQQITLAFSLLVFARVEEDIAKQAHGFKASFVHVKKSDLVKVKLPVPPLPEQRAIAAALSDVDALLEALTRLIDKKRDLKQAAMQQLLTGDKRLPGFHGKWEVKRLEEIGDIRSGGTPSTAHAHFWNGDIPWCTPTDITGLDGGKYLTETARTISAAGLQFSSAEVIPPRSLIMTSRATIGECAINLVPMTTNQGFKNIVPFAEIDVEFLYYKMTTQKSGLIALCGGSTFLEVGKKQLSAYALKVPKTKDEQIAIATVLSDMDAELAALGARRDKTRALKQAMMQELLTGRTRLVVPSVTESRKDSERTDGRQANIHFKRSVLAAEIIDRLHAEPTFGHVKFEKLIYLVEHLCDVDTGSTYHRDAAGPYDNRALRSIDSQLRKQKWFEAQKVDDRYRYEPLANRGKHKEYFERYFGGIGTTFDTVIETFRSFTTERCEIVATLFGAWRDLLQQNDSVSDDAIVNEVLNNWHKSKKRIPEERWRKALSWMRGRGFVPRKANGA